MHKEFPVKGINETPVGEKFLCQFQMIITDNFSLLEFFIPEFTGLYCREQDNGGNFRQKKNAGDGT